MANSKKQIIAKTHRDKIGTVVFLSILSLLIFMGLAVFVYFCELIIFALILAVIGIVLFIVFMVNMAQQQKLEDNAIIYNPETEEFEVLTNRGYKTISKYSIEKIKVSNLMPVVTPYFVAAVNTKDGKLKFVCEDANITSVDVVNVIETKVRIEDRL